MRLSPHLVGLFTRSGIVKFLWWRVKTPVGLVFSKYALLSGTEPGSRGSKWGLIGARSGSRRGFAFRPARYAWTIPLLRLSGSAAVNASP